jgi:hypothetical protein
MIVRQRPALGAGKIDADIFACEPPQRKLSPRFREIFFADGPRLTPRANPPRLIFVMGEP